MDTVRTTYKSPLTGKTKYITTKISIHGTRENAKEYLRNKKDSAIIRETKLKKIEESEKTKEKQPEEIEEEIEEPKGEPETQQKETESEIHNLMDVSVKSTPEIDNIIANMKFSKFHLDVNPDETGSSIVIFGSSKSYKTTLLKRILRDYYSEDTITLLSAPNVHAKIYKDLPKEILKTDQYKPEIVKAMYYINKKTDNRYPFVIALDDVIDKKNDGDLEKLFLTLRNAKISVIILLQNIQLLKSTSRGNANIVIFRKFNQANVIEDYVMKMYLQNFYPFRDLKMPDKVSLYMKLTNNHHFFVLDVINNKLTIHIEPELNE